MTTETKRTPGPWELRFNLQGAPWIAGPSGETVQWSDPEHPDHGYLFRAVNAHDALVEACTILVSTIEQLIPEPSARGVADVVLAQARSALARGEVVTA